MLKTFTESAEWREAVYTAFTQRELSYKQALYCSFAPEVYQNISTRITYEVKYLTYFLIKNRTE